MEEESYLFNSKNSENLPQCRKFMIANFVKVSRFYHVLTFFKNSDNDKKLSVFRQQHVDLQNKHGKGYT